MVFGYLTGQQCFDQDCPVGLCNCYSGCTCAGGEGPGGPPSRFKRSISDSDSLAAPLLQPRDDSSSIHGLDSPALSTRDQTLGAYGSIGGRGERYRPPVCHGAHGCPP
ncbi:hypothetical protein CBOM_00277 [Ceraceosorus bombacis]|uniref:Uncharacterized protein n=1 Tax=Ceraceosorus bombacis TaxID=401625 RepID=A0A0P1B8J3_9BASI|nr:hypothetical protein CBOM_00277 [Ceraceosorus bombacis]